MTRKKPDPRYGIRYIYHGNEESRGFAWFVSYADSYNFCHSLNSEYEGDVPQYEIFDVVTGEVVK